LAPRDDGVEGAARLERVGHLHRFHFDRHARPRRVGEPQGMQQRRAAQMRRDPLAGKEDVDHRFRMSARFAVNADRGRTWSTPAWRAALITSTCTCDAYPTVLTPASAGSLFMPATIASGFVRGLFKSKMTSDGVVFFISASALSGDRANCTTTPSWCAVVLIFDVNIRSSRTAKIIVAHDN